MRRLLLLLLMLAPAAGCWSQAAPAAPAAQAPSIAQRQQSREPWPGSARGTLRRPTEDRCARVITHVFALFRQDALANGISGAMLDEIEESSIESCHETAWSDESLDCYEGTALSSKSRDCYRSMTEEQREDFERRFTDIRIRHRNAPTQPATP